jgi:hypothetical protein
VDWAVNVLAVLADVFRGWICQSNCPDTFKGKEGGIQFLVGMSRSS